MMDRGVFALKQLWLLADFLIQPDTLQISFEILVLQHSTKSPQV